MATFFSNHIDYNKAFNETKRPVLVINDRVILDHNKSAADLLELNEGEFLRGKLLTDMIIRAYSEYPSENGDLSSMLALARKEGHNRIYAFCKTASNRIKCFHLRVTPFAIFNEEPIYFTVWGLVEMDDGLVDPALELAGHNIESFTNQTIKNLILKNSHLRSELIRFGSIESLFRVTQRSLQEILDIGKLGLWRFDHISNVLYFPPETCELLGINAEDDKGLKLTQEEYFDRFVILEDKTIFLNFCEEVKSSTSERHTFEYRIKNDRGEVMSLLSLAMCQRDAEGQLTACNGVFQDLTEMRRKNIELARYQGSLAEGGVTFSRFGSMSEETGMLFWEFDLASGYLSIAPSIVQRITGSSASFNGHIHINELKKLMNSKVRSQFKQIEKLTGNLSTETEVGHFLVSPNRNTKLRFTFKAYLDEKGHPFKYYGTVQDLGELKRSENEKNRLSKIIESTSDLVVILDKNEKLIYLNTTALRFFGLSDDAKLTEVPSSFLSASRISSAGLRQALKHGIWSGENTLVRPDKTRLPVSQVIIPHKDEAGQLEFVSIIYRDITHLKKVEKSLIRKNRELDNFVYKVSHDLRGPIASLMGLYNLASMELEDQHALNYIELYNQQILRLNNIVLSLIDLTRIKEQSLKKEPVDFLSITDDCIEALKYMPNADDIDIIKCIDIDKPVNSDQSLWNTILQNLLENAIKYSRSNIPSYVNIDVKRMNNNRILLEVSDNGVGIDPQFHDQIYDMFFRANDEVSGSGLGLYIVKSAVEKLSGNISFQSRINKGTTFKIIIPLEA